MWTTWCLWCTELVLFMTSASGASWTVVCAVCVWVGVWVWVCVGVCLSVCVGVDTVHVYTVQVVIFIVVCVRARD